MINAKNKEKRKKLSSMIRENNRGLPTGKSNEKLYNNPGN